MLVRRSRRPLIGRSWPSPGLPLAEGDRAGLAPPGWPATQLISELLRHLRSRVNSLHQTEEWLSWTWRRSEDVIKTSTVQPELLSTLEHSPLRASSRLEDSAVLHLYNKSSSPFPASDTRGLAWLWRTSRRRSWRRPAWRPWGGCQSQDSPPSLPTLQPVRMTQVGDRSGKALGGQHRLEILNLERQEDLQC